MEPENRPGKAHSIDEGLFVEIYGVQQWVRIRGSDLNNPVLLIVGGPGAALSSMALFFAPWERDFTVVQWDQPGAGATFGKNGEEGTGALTLDRIARDGVAVTEFVERRLHADKIVLLGFSGGSIIGLKMIKQRPDLFSAYVGSGQVVNWARQEALSYAMVLEKARAAGDQMAVVELEQIGPPPYQDTATDAIKSKYAAALTPAEQSVFAAVRVFPRQDVRALAMATYEKLRTEITSFDARRLGLKFDVPMFFFQGELDAYTVTAEVQAYEAEIQAPKKTIMPIKGGGHSCLFMRDEFLTLLNRFCS